MRLFAIGDIHGHLTALEQLLNEIPLSPDDSLIFLGDYVDKGPDVRGVLDLLVSLSERSNTIFLRGNHDQMMIDACRDPEGLGVWQTLGGNDPLSSYGSGSIEMQLGAVPASHWNFLGATCKDCHETDEFIFVHGGIRAHREPADEEVERLQWSTLGIADRHLSGRTVICGHSSQSSGKIMDLDHTVCIDTAISKGGFLTCLDLSQFEFWQVNNLGEVRSGMLRS